MTGTKPDPRLRTPMHWEPGPGAGFTTGTPWEPLQADSATANVAVESADPESLLSHYRRLIHLRTSEPALGVGRWVPLDAGTNGVATYLRETPSSAMLVAVNLRDAATGPLDLALPAGVLPTGDLRVEGIDGFAPGDPETLIRDGTRSWTLPALQPYATALLRITPGEG